MTDFIDTLKECFLGAMFICIAIFSIVLIMLCISHLLGIERKPKQLSIDSCGVVYEDVKNANDCRIIEELRKQNTMLDSLLSKRF